MLMHRVVSGRAHCEFEGFQIWRQRVTAMDDDRTRDIRLVASDRRYEYDRGQIGAQRVQVFNARGHGRPPTQLRTADLHERIPQMRVESQSVFRPFGVQYFSLVRL